MIPALEAVSKFLDLDQGAIPEFGIVMLAYMGSDGKMGFTYATVGEPNSLQVSGLMSVVTQDLFAKLGE